LLGTFSAYTFSLGIPVLEENPETFDINSNIIILPGQSLTLSKEAPAPTGQIHPSKLGQLHTSKFGQLHLASSVNAWPGHQSMLGLLISQCLATFFF
jgi:hypothetical protein